MQLPQLYNSSLADGEYEVQDAVLVKCAERLAHVSASTTYFSYRFHNFTCPLSVSLGTSCALRDDAVWSAVDAENQICRSPQH